MKSTSTTISRMIRMVHNMVQSPSVGGEATQPRAHRHGTTSDASTRGASPLGGLPSGARLWRTSPDVPQTLARGVDGGQAAGRGGGRGGGVGRRPADGSAALVAAARGGCGHRGDHHHPARRVRQLVLPQLGEPGARRRHQAREQGHDGALDDVSGRRQEGRPALRRGRRGRRDRHARRPRDPRRREVPLLLLVPPQHAGHPGRHRQGGRCARAAGVRAGAADPRGADRQQDQRSG